MPTCRSGEARGPRPSGRGRLLNLLSFVVLVGLAMVGLWWYLSPTPPPPPAEPSPEEKAKMETLSLTQIEEGGQRWKLNAQKAEYLKNRDEISIRGVYLEFYGADQETVYLWGDEGLVNTKSRDLIIRGNVKLAKGDLTIRTPEIQYFHKARTLVAPAEVVLEGPQAQIAGKDLHLDLARRRLLMKQHRLTTVNLEKGLL